MLALRRIRAVAVIIAIVAILAGGFAVTNTEAKPRDCPYCCMDIPFPPWYVCWHCCP